VDVNAPMLSRGEELLAYLQSQPGWERASAKAIQQANEAYAAEVARAKLPGLNAVNLTGDDLQRYREFNAHQNDPQRIEANNIVERAAVNPNNGYSWDLLPAVAAAIQLKGQDIVMGLAHVSSPSAAGQVSPFIGENSVEPANFANAQYNASVFAPRTAGAAEEAMFSDPAGIGNFSLSQKLDLQFKHQSLLTALGQGDVALQSGQGWAQLMGELTVASSREIGFIRIGDQRLLRLGSSDSIFLGDADRVIAHTHPSGVLRFSGEVGGSEGDIPSFNQYQPRQRSSFLVAPDGTAVRLPIPRTQP
jgi:hypothetical protein